jgi:hypothetical protein
MGHGWKEMAATKLELVALPGPFSLLEVMPEAARRNELEMGGDKDASCRSARQFQIL